ncbi:hypothetical protein EDD16DRAFT_556538 [Pisolithus croceorrhizus]|nr:hypothetical protein EDD16DRAFT_556538 [Pisolithus croceorrhizus]KAI6168480.1 hypothetical protein EDD17DRAFT_625781 [Pisolithus thermaeus]
MSTLRRLPSTTLYRRGPLSRSDGLSLTYRGASLRQGNSRARFRLHSTSTFDAPVKGLGGNFRVSTVFTALLVFGAGATALGLYQFYKSFTLWPKELRDDLRAGIKARNQGDLNLSERYLTRAYQTALTMPPSMLSPSAYLKLSGIASVLAEVSPERKAREVLEDVWNRGDGPLQGSSADDWASYTPADEERIRRVAVACKLAELSQERDEDEKWLVWAVEEVLKLAGAGLQKKPTDTDGSTDAQSQPAQVILAELKLPPWMSKDDLGAPLAALGNVYARKGKLDYAMPLYLQAISLLLPPGMQNVSIQDRCEAAQLMNNLSELIMRRPPTPEIRHQAEAWARKALDVIEGAGKMPLPRSGWFGYSEDTSARSTCDQVLGVVLFNIGMLREMDSDKKAARTLFEKSVQQCGKVGMDEGVLQAKEALRRVGRAQNETS